MEEFEQATFLRRSLQEVGYSDELIAQDFRRLPRGTFSTVDLVGFGVAEPKDASTAVTVAEVRRSVGEISLEQAFLAARDLAAPIVMSADQDELRVLATSTTEIVVTLPWRDIDELSKYRDVLGPNSLLEAKRGNRQLGLFPVPANVLAEARRSHRAILGAAIESVLRDLGANSRNSTSHVEVERQRNIYRAVGSALCALVLADKAGVRGGPDLTPTSSSEDEVLRYARNRLPSLFEWFTSDVEPAANSLQYAVGSLGSEIDFRKFDSNVLSQIYEEVLVDPSQRRKLGIHYTPVGLANKMLAHLPIEEIRPESRYVLDPACGSGTLLVAAHDRLSSLQPSYWDAATRHDDLRTRLRGQDQDPLAVELTKLALVLHAVPHGNGWSIEQRDSLAAETAPLPLDATVPTSGPTIIVANPPFELPVNEGARLDIAVRFLDVILAELAPGGVMAVVLPASWLSGTAATKSSRSRLQSVCDTFEVWRLPRDTFHQSRANTVVLFARKRHEYEGKRSASALVQHVPSLAALPAFYASQPNGAGRTIVDPFSRTGPVQALLDRRTSLTTLSNFVTVQTGAQPLEGHLNAARRGDFSDQTTRWLPHLGGLRQFGTVQEDRLLRTTWPTGFLRNIGRTKIDSEKILVGTQATSDAPYLRVVIDDTGIVASKSLLWLVPRDVTLEEHTHESRRLILDGVLALTASGLIATWLDEVSTGRNIRGTDLSQFPVPRSVEAWRLLATEGQRLRHTAQTGQPDRSQLLRLDEVVFEAYGATADDPLPAVVATRLSDVRDRAIGESRYLADTRYEENQLTEPLECDGIVRNVDTDRVQIEVPGITSSAGAWVNLPPGLTGRMSEPGAKVVVTLDEDDDLFRAKYRLHHAAWADEYELEELLRSATNGGTA